MLFECLFIGELILLYFFSFNISLLLSRLFFLITRSEKSTMCIMAFIFLPGTFCHELAHLLAAKMLFVDVKKMSLTPKMEKETVRLGSVTMQRTDPFRGFVIGIAPVILGVLIIILSVYFVEKYKLFYNYWILALLGYVSFEIGNSMFSSKKDMERSLEVFLFMIFLVILGYFLGVRIGLNQITQASSNPKIISLFKEGSTCLLFPVIVDGLCIILLKIFFRFFK